MKNVDLLKTVREQWERLSTQPGGDEEFSRLVGEMARYSGSIGATITEFRPSYAEGFMLDCPEVRNHLDCIHGIALANFAELIGGMALIASLGDGMRLIIRKFEIEFFEKARGRITARAQSPVIPTSCKTETYKILVDLHNSSNILVAQAAVYNQVGPLKTS